MDILAISEALNKAHVWHKIQDDCICTRRTLIKIPEINNKVAFLAGVIAGDGNLNVCKRKKGGYYYRVNIVGYEDDLEHLATIIADLFNYKPKILRDKRKADCYFINIPCAAIYVYFVQLGFPTGKKRGLHVPQIIGENPELFKYYMLGLIDTDGSVSKNRIHLKQREENFLKEIVQLLKINLNIESTPPKINYTKGRPFYYIRFAKNNLSPDF